MKKRSYGKWLMVAMFGLAGVLLPASAFARHGRGEFIIGLGWPGFFYPPAPYYYPPLVVAPPPPPPVYIERERSPSLAPPPQNYWYYCAESRGYYPYVKECPGGWLQVVPQPGAKP